MAHPTCPLPKEEQPHKCKWCPLKPEVRFYKCKFFRNQMRAGVPWRGVPPELFVKWVMPADVYEEMKKKGQLD